MSLELGLIAACLVVFGGAAGAMAVLSRLSRVRTLGWLGGVAPAARANLSLAWAALPLLAGLGMLAFVLTPSVAHALGLAADHCHAHGHHAHLCVVHSPLLTGSALEQLILGGATAGIAIWVVAAGRRLRPGYRAMRQLLALARPSSDDPRCLVVESAHAFAVTAGLIRPQVLVSSRLLEALRPAEVATVLWHEQAHRRRRDGLRLFAADLFARLHLPATRRVLLQHLRLAVEQACDEVAAQRSGDRLQVADTILKLTRLVAASRAIAAPVGVAFTGADTVRRVEGLLRPALRARSGLGAAGVGVTALLIALGLLTSDWWHHSAESLFGSLLG